MTRRHIRVDLHLLALGLAAAPGEQCGPQVAVPASAPKTENAPRPIPVG